MAPTEAGKAARVPPTQSPGHSGRTTSREGMGEAEERVPRRQPAERPPPPRSATPSPASQEVGAPPLTSGAGRERCWGTVWAKATVGRGERVSAEVGKTPRSWLGDFPKSHRGLGYFHLLVYSLFCPSGGSSARVFRQPVGLPLLRPVEGLPGALVFLS